MRLTKIAKVLLCTLLMPHIVNSLPPEGIEARILIHRQAYEEAASRRSARNTAILSLRKCGLAILPEALGDSLYLQSLDLGENELASVASFPWAHFTHLATLDLGANVLSGVPEELGSLSGLTALFLAHNQLTEVPQALTHLNALQTLGLSYNNIREIPAWLFDLPMLRHAFFHGNPTLSIACIATSHADDRPLPTLALTAHETTLTALSLRTPLSRRINLLLMPQGQEVMAIEVLPPLGQHLHRQGATTPLPPWLEWDTHWGYVTCHPSELSDTGAAALTTTAAAQENGDGAYVLGTWPEAHGASVPGDLLPAVTPEDQWPPLLHQVVPVTKPAIGTTTAAPHPSAGACAAALMDTL